MQNSSWRAVALVSLSVLLSACSQGVAPDGASGGAPEEKSRTSAIDSFEYEEWVDLSPSSPVDVCKVPDGQPVELQNLPRGAQVNGLTARGNVGFPFVPDRFPITGTARIVLGQAAFLDAPPSEQTPLEFFQPQVDQVSAWFDFWSQGEFLLDVQIIEDWIEIPVNSVDMPSDDLEIANIVLQNIPNGAVDMTNVDGTFIYWAIGTEGGDRHDFGVRVGSNEQSFVGRDRPELFWAPSEWHLEETSNGPRLKIKQAYTWAYLIHEILHEQGLNLHAPGNGWLTGLGQNQYPGSSGGPWSAALASWELWSLGWLQDQQVHCISVDELTSPQKVVLTPQEIYGGDKKIAVIPISDSDVLVIESRRPIGWTENWSPSDSGLLLYSVNPQIEVIEDHVGGDCGNDLQYPKWAYYIVKDNELGGGSCEGLGFKSALLKDGNTRSYKGITVTLQHSDDELDYVLIAEE